MLSVSMPNHAYGKLECLEYSIYLEKSIWERVKWQVMQLTQLSSDPEAMNRPHGEMADEHGWQRFTWFS